MVNITKLQYISIAKEAENNQISHELFVFMTKERKRSFCGSNPVIILQNLLSVSLVNLKLHQFFEILELFHNEILRHKIRCSRLLQQSFEDDLDFLLTTIKTAARKLNNDYRTQLGIYIQLFGERTRNDILEALVNELSSLSKAAYPSGGGIP